ncbi:ANTAR domain-containing protein [Streptacidiphilus monticola]
MGRLASLVVRLQREIERAHGGRGRAVIEMAKGLLMERLGCSAREASLQLGRLAEQAGLSPLEVAADLVGQAMPRAAAEALAGEEASRLRSAENAALAAHDCEAVADSLLRHALAPLGAVAVALWAALPDSSSPSPGRRASPSRSATAGGTSRRACSPRPGWPSAVGRRSTSAASATSARRRSPRPSWRTTAGSPSRPGCTVARSASWRSSGVPTRPGNPALARQLESLGEVAAHALDLHEPLPTASLEAVYPQLRELSDLADGLDSAALVLAPAVNADGVLTDFRIHHVNPHFADPGGRPRAALTGRGLLEAYPLAAAPAGLFDAVEHVYATGEPFRAPLQLSALVDALEIHSRARASLSRHGACVLLVWRTEAESDRLANLLQHAQRLGRIAGFEEDFRTGEVTWNEPLFDLYGLTPARTSWCTWRTSAATCTATTTTRCTASCARCCATTARRPRPSGWSGPTR